MFQGRKLGVARIIPLIERIHLLQQPSSFSQMLDPPTSKRGIPHRVYDFKRRGIKQMQKEPGRSNMKVVWCSESIGHLLRMLRLLVDDETRTLALTFPLLGEDNIAVTDGLWVIWASLRVSVHCELIVDSFHTNWYEWNKSILIHSLSFILTLFSFSRCNGSFIFTFLWSKQKSCKMYIQLLWVVIMANPQFRFDRITADVFVFDQFLVGLVLKWLFCFCSSTRESEGGWDLADTRGLSFACCARQQREATF